MERPTTGTSYPTIKDMDVETIKIPLLPIETQTKLAILVQQAYRAREKSKELLKGVKIIVERTIENEFKNDQ